MATFREVISGVFPYAVALAASVLKGSEAQPMGGIMMDHSAQVRKARKLLMVAEHELQGRLGHGPIDYGAAYGRFLVLVTEVKHWPEE